jgi:hypothetical protein
LIFLFGRTSSPAWCSDYLRDCAAGGTCKHFAVW